MLGLQGVGNLAGRVVLTQIRRDTTAEVEDALFREGVGGQNVLRQPLHSRKLRSYMGLLGGNGARGRNRTTDTRIFNRINALNNSELQKNV